MVTAFVRSAVLSSFVSEMGLDEHGVMLAGGWAVQQITSALLTDLFSGTITVYGPSHPAGSWSVVYGFRSGDVEYSWGLSAGPELNRVRRNSDAATDHSVLAHRPVASGWSPGESSAANNAPRSGGVCDALSPQWRVLSLTVENLFSHLDTWSPFRELTDLLEIGPTSSHASQMLGFRSRSLDDPGRRDCPDRKPRLPPQQEYSLEETTHRPDLADGSLTPIALYRLKNGSVDQRDRFRRTQELFAASSVPIGVSTSSPTRWGR